jgi:carboxypeptidase family protein
MGRARLTWLLGLLLAVGALFVVLDPLGDDDLGLGSMASETGEAGMDLAEGHDAADLAAGVNPADGPGRTSVVSPPLSTQSQTFTATEMGIPSFRGRVVLPTEKPVAGVKISAYAFPQRARGFDPNNKNQQPFARRQTTTDARGEFRLPESPNDRFHWILRIEAEAYPPLELNELTTIAGSTRDLGDLQLSAGASITGQVITEDGVPLTAATIEALRGVAGAQLAGWLEADSFPLPGYTATSARDGSFTLTDLPPGPIRLRATSPGYVRTFSAEVDLSAGDTVKALQLVLPKSRPLRGIITDLQGAALPLATIDARWDPHGQLQGGCNELGEFALDLPQNASKIRLQINAPKHARLNERIKDNRRDQILPFKLVPVENLRGYVVDDNNQPVAGAEVALFENARQRIARIAPWRVQALAQTTTQPDGTFVIEAAMQNSADTRYRLIAWTDGYSPAISGTLRFEQRNGKTPEILRSEIRLQLGRGGSLFGTVSGPNGAPVANARVQLRRHGNPRGGLGMGTAVGMRDGETIAATTTRADGSYRIANLSSNDVHLEAYAAGYSPARSDEFALGEAASMQVDLQLAAASGIHGAILGERSKLGRLQVLAMTPEGRIYPAFVDAAGNYRFSEIPPGAYRLELYSNFNGFRSQWALPTGPTLNEPVDVVLLESIDLLQDLELDLEEFASIHGQVLVNGLPSADYRLYLFPAGYEGSASDEDRQRVLEQLRSTLTDVQGRFRFDGLATEEFWLVLATPPGSPGGRPIGGITAEAGPSGLARARITLDGGESYRHDFMLQTAALRGRAIRDTKKGPLALKRGVGILRPGPEHQGARRFSFPIQRDGSFYLPAVPVGSWRLELRSGDYLLRNHEVFLNSGGELRQDFTLQYRKAKR